MAESIRPSPTQIFASGWFAAVMGTGAFALAAQALAIDWTMLLPLAWGLHGANLLLFVSLLLPWRLRWLFYPAAALQTLWLPVQSNFHPTFSIALMTQAARRAGALPFAFTFPLRVFANACLHLCCGDLLRPAA